eukprot:scaffold202583_cov29-Tisochrysis_lutea.AAC.2
MWACRHLLRGLPPGARVASAPPGCPTSLAAGPRARPQRENRGGITALAARPLHHRVANASRQ